MVSELNQTDVADATTGRTSNGQFAAGNRYGRGRPRREVERAYLEAFVGGCSAKQLEKIVGKLTAKALDGNLDAIKLLLRYAMPQQSLRLQLASHEEEYRVAGKSPAEGMAAMMQRITAKVQERREYEAQINNKTSRRGGPDQAAVDAACR